MRSFVRSSFTGFLICGVIGVVGCGGDDTTGTPSNSAGSSGSSAGSTGTAGSASNGGSDGVGGSVNGVGGSVNGVGGSAGSSAGNGGNGGSSQPDSGMGSGDAKTDTGAGSEASVAYNPCPAKGTPCAIMGLGDSITDGAGSSTGGSYRTFLFHLALSHQQTITLVGNNMTGPAMVDNVTFPKGNEGHSGYTIDDGGGRTGIHNLTAPAMQKFHPNIITLMIGTNDIDIQLDVANAPMRLGGLLDTIIATDPTVLIVLAQMVPTKDDTENIRVKAYNDAMPALVKARADAGKHIILVDMYGGFQADANYKTDYMNDNLHPKDPGYSKMGDIWYAAIGPLFR